MTIHTADMSDIGPALTPPTGAYPTKCRAGTNSPRAFRISCWGPVARRHRRWRVGIRRNRVGRRAVGVRRHCIRWCGHHRANVGEDGAASLMSVPGSDGPCSIDPASVRSGATSPALVNKVPTSGAAGMSPGSGIHGRNGSSGTGCAEFAVAIPAQKLAAANPSPPQTATPASARRRFDCLTSRHPFVSRGTSARPRAEKHWYTSITVAPRHGHSSPTMCLLWVSFRMSGYGCDSESSTSATGSSPKRNVRKSTWPATTSQLSGLYGANSCTSARQSKQESNSDSLRLR